MPPSKNSGTPDPASLEALAQFGFGLDGVLMNDPKILVDSRFLASLLREFEDELGTEGAAGVLFQVGLIHGLRDAERALSESTASANGDGATRPHAATPIAMDLERGAIGDGGVELRGSWPERFEAEARLSHCGASASPACALSAGYTSGWLSGAYDLDLLVVEETCASAGAARCAFRVRELAAWRDTPEAVAPGRDDVDLFTRCRDAASGGAEAGSRDGRDAAPAAGRFDPSDDAVHIWGPVMVLPLTHIEEALCTVEMLSRDPSTQAVGVVVVDLRQHPLDDAMMAVGLERIIDILSSWGAEVLLTGVSSIAEPIVAELESAHLLTRKELPDAVAAAFQIAEAQRHAL